ncbi:MAG: hypothetical protein WBV62_09060, partial [Roseobacter sp.]
HTTDNAQNATDRYARNGHELRTSLIFWPTITAERSFVQCAASVILGSERSPECFCQMTGLSGKADSVITFKFGASFEIHARI